MGMREEDIVIVGAGIAGLTTALGLHRLGLKCLVLESSDTLRVTGFALTLWTNAWRSLDALGVGDSLRMNYSKIGGFREASSVSGLSAKLLPEVNGKNQDYECRCVRRVELLETLVKELPPNIINYSSKVASIEDSKYYKILHLADGSTIRTKVLIGCDGVNSIVSKRLGLQKPVHSGRSAIRGFVEFPDGHDFEARFHVHFGGGVRYGFIPCYGNFFYWFCTYNSSLQQDEEMEGDPLKMKQFILNKLSKLPKQATEVVEKTELSSISCSPLKFRVPWNVVLGNIAKDNVTVAGDALHPMTPDIGQGGCSALEDSVVLARCLGEVFLKKEREEETTIEEEAERIKKGLEKYAKERRWRSFRLISTAYLVGLAQQSDGKVMRFLKEKFLADFTNSCFWKMADYHCGNLITFRGVTGGVPAKPVLGQWKEKLLTLAVVAPRGKLGDPESVALVGTPHLLAPTLVMHPRCLALVGGAGGVPPKSLHTRIGLAIQETQSGVPRKIALPGKSKSKFLLEKAETLLEEVKDLVQNARVLIEIWKTNQTKEFMALARRAEKATVFAMEVVLVGTMPETSAKMIKDAEDSKNLVVKAGEAASKENRKIIRNMGKKVMLRENNEEHVSNQATKEKRTRKVKSTTRHVPAMPVTTRPNGTHAEPNHNTHSVLAVLEGKVQTETMPKRTQRAKLVVRSGSTMLETTRPNMINVESSHDTHYVLTALEDEGQTIHSGETIPERTRRVKSTPRRVSAMPVTTRPKGTHVESRNNINDVLAVMEGECNIP